MNNRIRMIIKALKVACHWKIGQKVKVVIYYKGKKWGEVGGRCHERKKQIISKNI